MPLLFEAPVALNCVILTEPRVPSDVSASRTLWTEFFQNRDLAVVKKDVAVG